MSNSSASTNATLRPPEMTVAVHSSRRPGITAPRKLTLISAFRTKTFLSRALVRADAPMAESQIAERNPPWMMPAGLQKRSSAAAVQIVTPGTDFSVHTMPKVRSQLGGTWIRGDGTRET